MVIYFSATGNSKYCAVFTCGKSCGIAAEEMKEVLQQKGLYLNAACNAKAYGKVGTQNKYPKAKENGSLLGERQL